MTPVLAMPYLTHDTWHRYLPCYIWHMIPDTGTCHAIFDLWYPTLVLAMLYLHMIPDTGTCHAIFNTWYLTPIFAMQYLTLDKWHRYLPCYPWPWYMTPVLAMLSLTWYMTPVLAMLSLTLIYDTGTCHAILDTWWLLQTHYSPVTLRATQVV